MSRDNLVHDLRVFFSSVQPKLHILGCPMYIMHQKYFLLFSHWNTGRFATGKVYHRKVRHKIGRFATALEGSPQR